MPDPKAAIAEHVALAGRMTDLLPRVEGVARLLIETYERGRRVYTFGNGGSAADSLHFAEELVARFRRHRRPLAAQSLAADATALTCIGNDFGFEELFARQLRAFARAGDVAIGFTTTGRSANVVRGLGAACDAGAATVVFAGGNGLPAAADADHVLLVPSEDPARVQEMHVLLLHLVLEDVDEWAAAAEAAR
jgi:D-sedoheptulose 7-phosphate isomerase